MECYRDFVRRGLALFADFGLGMADDRAICRLLRVLVSHLAISLHFFSGAGRSFAHCSHPESNSIRLIFENNFDIALLWAKKGILNSVGQSFQKRKGISFFVKSSSSVNSPKIPCPPPLIRNKRSHFYNFCWNGELIMENKMTFMVHRVRNMDRLLPCSL